MKAWLKGPVTKDFLDGIMVGWASALVLVVLTIIFHGPQ